MFIRLKAKRQTKSGQVAEVICVGVFFSAQTVAASRPADEIQLKTNPDKETTSQLQLKFERVNVVGLPTAGQMNIPSLADQTVILIVKALCLRASPIREDAALLLPQSDFREPSMKIGHPGLRYQWLGRIRRANASILSFVHFSFHG